MELVPPDTIEKQPRGFQIENLSAMDIFGVGYAAFWWDCGIFCIVLINCILML